jgi:hypothetical protein
VALSSNTKPCRSRHNPRKEYGMTNGKKIDIWRCYEPKGKVTIFLIEINLRFFEQWKDICPEQHLPRTTFAQKTFAQKTFAQKDICPDGHLPRRGRFHLRFLLAFLRPRWRRRPTGLLCFSRAITRVIAREKQREQLGSGTIADGETRAKNASGNGP